MFRSAIAAALCIATTPAVFAADFAYTYLQVAYIDSELEVADIDIDGDVIELIGSLAAAERVALTFELTDESYDFDIDGETLQLGADYHMPLSAQGDLVIGVNYIEFELRASGGSDADDSGNLISVGYRGELGANSEILAEIFRVEFDDSETGFEIDVLLRLDAGPSVVAGIGRSDDNDRIGIGLRAEF